jgi:hypothetical protein
MTRHAEHGPVIEAFHEAGQAVVSVILDQPIVRVTLGEARLDRAPTQPSCRGRPCAG